MAFLAEAFGSWIIGELASVTRKRLSGWLLGSEQERALRAASRAAIIQTAGELRPGGSVEGIENVARVVDAVFQVPAPAASFDEHATMLQALQAAIATHVAVLGDASLTGTGRSSAQVLDVTVEQITEGLTRNVVWEILKRGLAGGALTPLADQLNHDLSHLQMSHATGMLGQVLEELSRLRAQRTTSKHEVAQETKVSGKGTAYALGMGQLTANNDYRTHHTDRRLSPGGPETGLVEGSLDPPVWLLPERIRGRTELLTSLLPLVEQPHGVHVLAGLGGCGKSTIALAIAHAALKRKLVTFWITVSDVVSLHTAMMSLAARCSASEQDLADLATGRRFGPDIVWGRLISLATPWLIVFDGADSPELLAGGGDSPASGVGWVRHCDQGTILITTRWKDPAAWGRFAMLHEVGPLPTDDGALMLLDEAGVAAGSLQQARRLAERLNGIPVALRWSGRYLADPLAATHTFDGYHRALEERFADVMDIPGDARGRRDTVRQTWEISLDFLVGERQMPEARALMQMLSCLAAQPLPQSLLHPAGLRGLPAFPASAQLTEARLRRILAGLRSLGLIDAQGETLLTHQLVLDAVAANLHGTQAEPDIWRSTIMLVAGAIGKRDASSSDQWPWWRVVIPHVRAMLNKAPILDETTEALVADIAYGAGEYLHASGLHREAEAIAVQFRDRARITLGEEHPSVLRLGYLRARALTHLARWAEAKQEFYDVVQAQSRLLGPEDPNVLSTRNDLGFMLRMSGNIDDGEREYREVYEIKRRVLGEENPSTLTTHSNLAMVLLFKGDLRSAEAELREILAIRRRVLGDNDSGTLRTRHHIARLLREQGRLDEAEEEFRQLLRLRSEALGAEHNETLLTRGGLARVMHAKRDLDYAQREFEAIREVRERLWGAVDRRTLDTRRSIARVMRDRGYLNEAAIELEAVWETQRRVLGEAHFDTLRTRHDLAGVLADQGRLAEAINHLVYVYQMRAQLLGKDHPETQATHASLRGYQGTP
jgi:tetratricopeptide (TPR) repeat protein